MRSFVFAAVIAGFLVGAAMMATACGDYANTVRGDVFVPNASGPNPNNLPNANGVPKPGQPGGHPVSHSPVVFSEVLVDAPGLNAGNQYVELLNAGAGDADIGGWVISSGASTFTFGFGFRLAAGERVVVHLGQSGTNSSSAQFAPSFAELGDGGSLALLRGGNDLVDFVQWGSGGNAFEAAASAAGLWVAGTALAVPAEGLSLHNDVYAGWVEGAMSPGA